MNSNTNTTRSSDVKVKMNKGKSKNKEEQVEVSKELDYLFEKELIMKQNKHIHIMEKFGPSRNTHYLSTKFYARHDQYIPEKYFAFVPFVYGSSYKHDTEANVFGWMPEIVNKTNVLKELNFVSAPKQRCCLTIYGEELERDKTNARPPFNGSRFFLH